MILTGHENDLLKRLLRDYPDAIDALAKSGHIKGQLKFYQAAALYALARRYDKGSILEIGTLVGYSVSIIAQAAPNATIVTLNPTPHEAKVARKNLVEYPNVTVVEQKSWDYFNRYDGPFLDMVFVDGDHKNVAQDLPWWSWIKRGGLMLFHDYTEHCSPHVCRAVDGMSEILGKGPDVLLVDDEDVGMAGFIK